MSGTGTVQKAAPSAWTCLQFQVPDHAYHERIGIVTADADSANFSQDIDVQTYCKNVKDERPPES